MAWPPGASREKNFIKRALCVSCDEELADFRDKLSLRPYVSCVSGQERSEVGERCRQGAYPTLGSGLEALLNAEKSIFEHRRTQKVPPIRNLVAQQAAAKIWYCSCGQRPPILEAFFFFEGILFSLFSRRKTYTVSLIEIPELIARQAAAKICSSTSSGYFTRQWRCAFFESSFTAARMRGPWWKTWTP